MEEIDDFGVITERDFYYISFNYFSSLVEEEVKFENKDYKYNKLTTIRVNVTKDGNFFNRFLKRQKKGSEELSRKTTKKENGPQKIFLDNLLFYIKEYLMFIRYTFDGDSNDCFNQLKIIGLSQEYCAQLSSKHWPDPLKRQLLKFNLLWNFKVRKSITEEKVFNFK